MSDIGLALHDAYVAGDLDRILELTANPDTFPTQQRAGPGAVGEIPLEYAIYHSPLPLVRRLLELGADPNYGDHAGFPALIAALSTERDDLLVLLELLVGAGADLEQRGLNGFTPLHYAARYKDPQHVEFLLERGADPSARTTVDDHTTPLEEAVDAERAENAAVLTDAAR